MRMLRKMVAAAAILGGLVGFGGQASARPMTPPALIHVTADVAGPAASPTAAPSCDRVWGNRRHWRRGYGWHHPRYGFRPFRPAYGWHRGWRHGPYGYHHGWRRRW